LVINGDHHQINKIMKNIVLGLLVVVGLGLVYQNINQRKTYNKLIDETNEKLKLVMDTLENNRLVGEMNENMEVAFDVPDTLPLEIIVSCRMCDGTGFKDSPNKCDCCDHGSRIRCDHCDGKGQVFERPFKEGENDFSSFEKSFICLKCYGMGINYDYHNCDRCNGVGLVIERPFEVINW
jgi:hypothetical protein